MKKLLTVLGVLVLVAALGALGYVVYDGLLSTPLGEAVPVDASSGAGPEVKLNEMKPVETPADILDAIDYAYRKNKDTVGWLNIADTQISASVFQSFDNFYYLRRNERKEDQVYGCYFADYACNFGAREELSPNTVIYGHSDLKDNPEGPKFSQLFKFTDESFAKKHPVIQFSTLEDTMVWQVFAVFYTDINLNFTEPNYEPEGLQALIDEARARSLYDYDLPVTGQDKILTLVTCTVEYNAPQDQQRFVIMAKLMPADAAAPATASLKVNSSPKQPMFK